MSSRTIPIDPADLHQTFCFGVAGNFAGHLEQAGEAVDFVHVTTAAAQLPKGIFPWYAPGSDTFLGTFPISTDTLDVPVPHDPGAPIQVEPELGVLFDLERDANGAARTLVPRWAAAFDDCSLRRRGAPKISEKKNWGPASKGLAPRAFPVTDLARDGAVGSLRLASFLRRGDETHAYGVDSAIPTYTLFGQELVDWLVERLANQRGSADTPLEDVGALLAASPDVTSVLVGVGATRYEPYGETTFVEIGDQAIVVVYDSAVHDQALVATLVAERRDSELDAASVLRRVARHA